MNAERSNGGREPQNIEERTLTYASHAVYLLRVLHGQDDRAGWVIGNQYLRVVLSIGANVSEARSGESCKDFIHKMQISQKEARECLFRLKLMALTSMLPPKRIEPLLGEIDEIIAIITTIIKNTKRND